MKTMTTLAACALSVMALSALSFGVQAQQLYRIIGPDGRVTFSDQPPAVAPGSKNTPIPKGGSAATTGSGGAATSGGAGLPAELRAVSNKFPVTLYTGKDCNPCATARNMLAARGVPFTEKTVDSNENIDLMSRIFSSPVLPSATIGGQQLKGYSDTEWSQYLDAAGYPKSSTLPASYRNPAATPLVAKTTAPVPAPAAAPAPAVAAPVALPDNTPAPSNPAGIKF